EDGIRDRNVTGVQTCALPISPKHYGGTERIVSYLTEGLVRAGHDVTLFASGDSVTSARLIASCGRSLRKNERCKDPVAREVLLEIGRASCRERGERWWVDEGV